MRISDWSSDVCSSDLDRAVLRPLQPHRVQSVALGGEADVVDTEALDGRFLDLPADANLAGFGRAFAEIFERPRPVDRLAVDLEPLAHALEHRRDFRRDGAVGLGADVEQQIAVLAADKIGRASCGESVCQYV